MATFDPTGRPPGELNTAPTNLEIQYVRPFSDFGRVGTADDTAIIQDALDWTSSVNGTDGTAKVAVGQKGIFAVDGLVIKHGARVACPGQTATLFTPVASPAAAGLIMLDSGPVQNVELSGFAIDMSISPAQHAILLKADPIFISGATQGGFWDSALRRIKITGCTGESIWFWGGDDSHEGPHQFITLDKVHVVSSSTTRRALRLTGQVGQLWATPDCVFDGLSRTTAGENILIQRTVDSSEVNNGDASPYSIWLPCSIQSRHRLVTVERGVGIYFDYAHFEQAVEGVQVDVSSNFVSVEKATWGVVGCQTLGSPSTANSGFCVRSDNGLVVVGSNNFGGDVDNHYVRRFSGNMVLNGGDTDSNGMKFKGVTLAAMTAASTLTTALYDHVFVNGSTTVINTLTSDLPIGATLSVRANGGSIVIGTSGNIDTLPWRGPLTVPQDSTITFRRNDLSGVWKVLSMSGPQGHRNPEGAFVNHAASPYQAVCGIGTIRVDASSGDVTIKLPTAATTNSGERVIVKRLDSSGNNVFINGSVTGENPDGQADNVIKLTHVTQAIEFERNGNPGSGGWDTIGSVNARSGTVDPSIATLTFGTHLTGGSFDGSTGVTIATDATAANTASAIVARDGSGDFAAHSITLSGFLSALRQTSTAVAAGTALTTSYATIGLGASVVAGTWKCRWVVVLSTAAGNVGGVTAQVTFPTATTAAVATSSSGSANNVTTHSGSSTTSSPAVQNNVMMNRDCSSANNRGVIEVTALLVLTASGTIDLQMLKVTGADTVTVLAGSFLDLTQIA